MSITDELRMYVQDWRDTPSLMDDLDRGDIDGILEDFIHIADRIDERHRKALERVAAMVDEPDEIERRVKALEHLTDGMLLEESELRERVEKVERKMNHRGDR